MIVAGVIIQALKGFPHFELGLYFKSLYGIQFVLFACLCVLAVLAHVLINQKYVGHFAMVVYLASGLLFPLLGLEHHLYRYATVPAHPYSAMNGYGHFVAPMAWFELYWVAVAAALAVVANLFWVRGTPQRFRERAREARRATGPGRSSRSSASRWRWRSGPGRSSSGTPTSATPTGTSTSARR